MIMTDLNLPSGSRQILCISANSQYLEIIAFNQSDFMYFGDNGIVGNLFHKEVVVFFFDDNL